jgi:hypothetical protein
MRKLIISAALALITAASGVVIAEAPASDPVIGSWKMDASKSTFTGSPALKSQTRTYSQSGQSITLVMKSTSADGKEVTTRMTYQLDGKDHPVTGNPDFDSISGQQVDSNTATFTQKKGGKRVGTSNRTVSKDGKTLHVQSSLTTAKGENSESVLVLNKQ